MGSDAGFCPGWRNYWNMERAADEPVPSVDSESPVWANSWNSQDACLGHDADRLIGWRANCIR